MVHLFLLSTQHLSNPNSIQWKHCCDVQIVRILGQQFLTLISSPKHYQLDIFYFLRRFQSFLKSLLAKMSHKVCDVLKKYGKCILLGHLPNFSRPSLITFVSSAVHSFLVPDEVTEVTRDQAQF